VEDAGFRLSFCPLSFSPLLGNPYVRSSLLDIIHISQYNKKAVLSQGNRAMPQLFFSV